jgi:hypothetical protein
MPRPGFPIGLLLGALWAQAAAAGVPQQDPAAATTAQPAAAQPSTAAPVAAPPNARALGVGEALLDYCAQNDPTAAAKVRARLKQLMQGAGKEALAEARRSDEYRRAHDSEADFLGKVDPHNAHRVCSDGSGPK